jgi:hypothetical protein
MKGTRVLPGLLALAAAAALFYWAYRIEANQPMAMLALVLFAGVVISLLLALLAVFLVFLRLGRIDSIDLKQCEAGREYRLRAPVLPAALALFAPTRVEWEAVEPASKTTGIDVHLDDSGREIVQFGRRCVVHKLRRLFGVGDRLGLFRFAIAQILPVRILVLPRKTNFKRAALSGGASDLDMRPDLSGAPEGDLIETRQYQEGESAKNILWKVAARTGGQRLIVRTEERITGSKTALYFLAAGPGDDVAAEFVRYFIEQSGRASDWILGVSGNRKVYQPGKKAQALEALAMTGAVAGCDWKGLEDFATSQAPRFGVRVVTVVVGGELGETSRAIVAQIAAKAKGSTIVFCPAVRTSRPVSLPGRARIVYPDGVAL